LSLNIQTATGFLEIGGKVTKEIVILLLYFNVLILLLKIL
jgi:hypothetical protein